MYRLLVKSLKSVTKHYFCKLTQRANYNILFLMLKEPGYCLKIAFKEHLKVLQSLKQYHQ